MAKRNQDNGEAMQGYEEIDILTGKRTIKGVGQSVVDNVKSIWGGSYYQEE